MTDHRKMHSSEFEKKKESAVKELNHIISTGPLNSKIKDLIFSQMLEYKFLYEDQLPSNDENMSNSNSMENSWGKNNNINALLERKRIMALENTIEELNGEIYKLRSENKRRKIHDYEIMSEEVNKTIKEYEETNIKFEKEYEKTKERKKELEMNSEKTIERLSMELKKMKEEVKEVKNKDDKETKAILSLNIIHELEKENSELNERINRIEDKMKIKENMIERMNEELKILNNYGEDVKKSKYITKMYESIEVGEVEKMLSEELKYIAIAYDKVIENNELLKKEIQKMNKENMIFFEKNALLEGQLKDIEDLKLFIEKEKIKNEKVKGELKEKEIFLVNKEEEMENILKENEKKINIYVKLLKENELNLENERNDNKNIKKLYKETKIKINEMIEKIFHYVVKKIDNAENK